MAGCEFFIVALHHFLCLCNNDITSFLSILLNLLLRYARLESNCPVDIQRQPEHVSSATATVTTSCYIVSTRISGCCPSFVVILVVSVDLHLWCVKSSECKQVMSCMGVGKSLISVDSYTA